MKSKLFFLSISTRRIAVLFNDNWVFWVWVFLFVCFFSLLHTFLSSIPVLYILYKCPYKPTFWQILYKNTIWQTILLIWWLCPHFRLLFIHFPIKPHIISTEGVTAVVGVGVSGSENGFVMSVFLLQLQMTDCFFNLSLALYPVIKATQRWLSVQRTHPVIEL